MTSEHYNKGFFKEIRSGSRRSAEVIVPEATGLYAASALTVPVFLLIWTKPSSCERGRAGVAAPAKECVVNGWAILTASTGAMLVVSTGRLAASAPPQQRGLLAVSR